MAYFSSKAALYQVAYSIMSYLIYFLNRQSTSTQYNIKLVIDNTEQSTRLIFEYNGLVIEEEKELLQASHYYFKHHANPFLLNMNQIFSLLRNDGFDCKLSSSGFNIIEILRKRSQEDSQSIKKKDNVIAMSRFIEKNK